MITPALSIPIPQDDGEHVRIAELMAQHYERLHKILVEIDEYLAEIPVDLAG
jgi:polysaccharide pyruvyl transferase WcaK-like protein